MNDHVSTRFMLMVFFIATIMVLMVRFDRIDEQIDTLIERPTCSVQP